MECCLKQQKYLNETMHQRCLLAQTEGLRRFNEPSLPGAVLVFRQIWWFLKTLPLSMVVRRKLQTFRSVFILAAELLLGKKLMRVCFSTSSTLDGFCVLAKVSVLSLESREHYIWMLIRLSCTNAWKECKFPSTRVWNIKEPSSNEYRQQVSASDPSVS